MAVSSEFDDYEHSYDSAVGDAIKFSHQGHEFFTRAKVNHLLQTVRRYVGDPADQRVLDVGCGPGATDKMLVPEVGSLHGVDSSEGMISQAQRTNPQVEYRTYDGKRLPFDDAAFDVTFAICVLHHVALPDWSRFVTEIGRVTKPTGVSMIFEHNPYNPLTRSAVNKCPFDEGVTLAPKHRTVNLYEQAGLQVLEKRYILFIPFKQDVSIVVDRALRWLPLGGQYFVAAQPRP